MLSEIGAESCILKAIKGILQALGSAGETGRSGRLQIKHQFGIAGLISIGAALTTPVQAADFSFFGLNMKDHIPANHPDLHKCGKGENTLFCKLNKETFAGIKITKSEVWVTNGRIAHIFVYIAVKDFDAAVKDFDAAVKAFDAKYGDSLERRDIRPPDALGRREKCQEQEWAFGPTLATLKKCERDEEALFSVFGPRNMEVSKPKVDF